MQRLGICGIYRRRYEDDPSSHIDCVPQTVTPPYVRLPLAPERRECRVCERPDGPLFHPGHRGSLWASHSGGNKQAVDRLDVGVEERSLRPESATPAQPAPAVPGGHVIGSAAISGSYEEGAWFVPKVVALPLPF